VITILFWSLSCGDPWPEPTWDSPGTEIERKKVNIEKTQVKV